MNLEEIQICLHKYGIEAAGVIPILAGQPKVPKYQVTAKSGEKFFARPNYPYHIFQKCRAAFDCGSLIQEPYFHSGDENALALFRWVEGESVHQAIRSSREEHQKILNMAYLAGVALKSIQSCPSDGVLKRPLIQCEAVHYLEIVDRTGIPFPYKDYFYAIFEEEMPDARMRSLTHCDFHTNNMILNSDESQVTVIDYENLSDSHPWRDFAYSLLLHNSVEHLFWYSLILFYFDGSVPETFWNLGKCFAALQILRILLHKIKTESEESAVSFIAKVAPSLYQNYSHSRYPPWVQRLEQYKETILTMGAGLPARKRYVSCGTPLR